MSGQAQTGCTKRRCARGGIGRYVRELFRHLGPEARERETMSGFFFDFKRSQPGGGAAERMFGRGANLRVCRWLPGRLAQGAWKHFHAPPYNWFAGEADLYHFPNFIQPPLSRSRKSVVTIHDLAFMRMPETTEKKNLAWLTAEIRRTTDNADAILTVSNFSAREIHECLGVEKNFPIIGKFFTAPARPGLARGRTVGRAPPASKNLHFPRPPCMMPP